MKATKYGESQLLAKYYPQPSLIATNVPFVLHTTNVAKQIICCLYCSIFVYHIWPFLRPK